MGRPFTTHNKAERIIASTTALHTIWVDFLLPATKRNIAVIILPTHAGRLFTTRNKAIANYKKTLHQPMWVDFLLPARSHKLLHYHHHPLHNAGRFFATRNKAVAN